MALDICNPFAGARSLVPSCEALKKPGGINKEIKVGQLADVESFAIDPVTKEVTGIAFKTGKGLLRLVGKKFTNSSTTTPAQTPNGPEYTHEIAFSAFTSTQLEVEAIEALEYSEELFAVVKNNYGKFEIFGAINAAGRKADGLSLASEASTSGVNNGDPTAIPLRFTGPVNKRPVLCRFGETEAAEEVYLDGLVVAEPVVEA